MSNLCPLYCFWGEILERPLMSSFMSSNIQGKYIRIYTSLLLQFIFRSVRSCFQIRCTSVFISTEESPFCTAKMCVYIYIFIDHVLYICLKYINQMFDYIHFHCSSLKTTSWGSLGVVLRVTPSVPTEVVGYLVMRSGRQNAKVFAKQVLDGAVGCGSWLGGQLWQPEE